MCIGRNLLVADYCWQPSHGGPIAGVEMFRETLTKAEAGDNCGALVKGVKRNEIRRGQVLCQPGTCTMHNHIQSQIYILSTAEGGSDKPITNNYQPQMFCQTWNFPVYIQVKDKKMIMPGEDAAADVIIKNKMVNTRSSFRVKHCIICCWRIWAA